MSKFKVGDRVRIVTDGANSVRWHAYTVGDIGIVTYVYEDGDYEVGHQTLRPEDIEPITPTNTLTPGQHYTSRNGNKWECIFVRDGKAWMVGVYGGKTVGSAYAFDVDGTASWVMEHDRAAYNIVFEPVRTTHYHKIFAHGEERNTKYDVVDGMVDWDSLEILPCE